jgi:hypothetical protein
MKKIVFLLSVVFAATLCNAQSVMPKTIEQYCSLNVMPRLLSNKVNIDVDYGNPRKLFSFKDNRVKDDDGKAKKFNTAVEALNYMSSQGWKLVNAMAITESGNAVYRYIMKREIEVTEEERKKIEEAAATDKQ